ncbi:MAG: DNA primase [Granulosicoccus sp.]
MAGRIPQTFIDELLSRVDIVDIIDQRVTLKKSGTNYSACCPFHTEKTPSFTVSQTKQFYHCFGCSANGNAIGFLMEYDSMHFVDAIESLAESVGMEVPRNAQSEQRFDEKRPLYDLMESVSAHYQAQLKQAPAAIEYLKQRGLTGDTALRFGIGFATQGWDGLQKQFPGKEAELIKAGLLIRNDAQNKAYQRFRNRIMFPIRDRRGRVIGFGGRVMDNAEPKYLNSPETVLFHKATELYGLYEARKAAQHIGYAIVVEGYMDVVALAQHGINHAVATLGTAANQQHTTHLFKVVPTIVFCFDGDRAGRAAAWRALQATLPCLGDRHDAEFLFLPDGEDPDSIVRSGGANGFNALLAHRVQIIDFLYDYLAAESDQTTFSGKSQLVDKARPLLETIPDSTYKQLALQQFEKRASVSLNLHVRNNQTRGRQAAERLREAPLTPMRRAVLLVSQHPGVVRRVPPDDIDIDLTLPGAELLVKLIGYCDADENMTTGRLLERFRDTDHYDFLLVLARRPYWPDNRELDFETATHDFIGCIAQLRSRSNQVLTGKLEPAKKVGLLSRFR